MKARHLNVSESMKLDASILKGELLSSLILFKLRALGVRPVLIPYLYASKWNTYTLSIYTSIDVNKLFLCIYSILIEYFEVDKWEYDIHSGGVGADSWGTLRRFGPWRYINIDERYHNFKNFSFEITGSW